AFVLADLALPRRQQVEALIGGGKLPRLELAPNRLHLCEVTDNIDAGDASSFRPCGRFRRPVIDRSSDGHRKTRTIKNLHFCRQPTFAKKCQQRVMTVRRLRTPSPALRDESLPSDNPLLTSLKLELAYFSGRAWQSREVGGAGVILRFQRIRPRRGG